MIRRSLHRDAAFFGHLKYTLDSMIGLSPNSRRLSSYKMGYLAPPTLETVAQVYGEAIPACICLNCLKKKPEGWVVVSAEDYSAWADKNQPGVDRETGDQ